MTFPAPDIRVATKSTISPSAERAQHRSLLHGAKLLRPGCVPAARPLCQPLPVPQELPDRASPDKLRAQPGCLENISLACSRGCACVCEWSAGSDTKARPTRRVPGRNRAYCNTTSPGSGLLNSHNALKKKVDGCQPLPPPPKGSISFLSISIGKVPSLIKKTALARAEG